MEIPKIPVPRPPNPNSSPLISILFPYKSPIDRGKLISTLLSKNQKLILIPGYKISGNRDSLSTLAIRLFLKRRCPRDQIVKINSKANIGSILSESIGMAEFLLGDIPGSKIHIFCLSRDIPVIQKKIKALRKGGLFVGIKFYYLGE